MQQQGQEDPVVDLDASVMRGTGDGVPVDFFGVCDDRAPGAWKWMLCGLKEVWQLHESHLAGGMDRGEDTRN